MADFAPTRPGSRPPAAARQDMGEYGMEYAAPAEGPASGRQRQGEYVVPPAPLGLVALYDLWNRTKGTLSLDLKRRQYKGGAPGDSLWRVSGQQPAAGAAAPGRRGRGRPPGRAPPPPPAQSYYGQPTGYGGAPPGAYAAPARGAYGGGPAAGGGGAYNSFPTLPSFTFMDTGARVKVMRHIQFGPEFEVVRPSGARKLMPALDFGVGLAFEIDTAELRPQARLKFRDIASLRALPYPSIKIQKRLSLPNDSSWGVRLSYECPLEDLASFYRPPARIMLSIDNMHTNGVQLSQAGLEFNYAGEFWDGYTQLRAQGLVALPRELPVVEGQPLVGLELKRLGLKARW